MLIADQSDQQYNQSEFGLKFHLESQRLGKRQFAFAPDPLKLHILDPPFEKLKLQTLQQEPPQRLTETAG